MDKNRDNVTTSVNNSAYFWFEAVHNIKNENAHELRPSFQMLVNTGIG